MEITRRQFALTLAATSTLGSSLFNPPLSPLSVPRGILPGLVTWAYDPAAVTRDGTGSWWQDANNHQPVIDRMATFDKVGPKCEDPGRSVRRGTNSKLEEFNDEL